MVPNPFESQFSLQLSLESYWTFLHFPPKGPTTAGWEKASMELLD